MAVTNIDNTVSAPHKKYGTAKKWLQRRVRKVISRQSLLGARKDTDVQEKLSLQRPRTAPRTEAAPNLDKAAASPTYSIKIERVSPHHPPVRPARPDSNVIRDVHAWLEASMNIPSPPLMPGVSYWKEATVPGVKSSAVAQYAVPLFVASGLATSAASTGQKRTSCQHWKMRVRIPSLSRIKAQCPLERKKPNKYSASAPLLAVSYKSIRQAAAPVVMKRSTSATNALIQPSKWNIAARGGGLLSATPTSTSFGDSESDSERHIYTLFMRTARSAESTRPSTAGAGLVREDSLGDLSDAPTYCSGPPPPPYRSRPESILTTSSFGCIDGMNPVQRQISQQRAALQRGMRCKLKRFAKNFVM